MLCKYAFTKKNKEQKKPDRLYLVMKKRLEDKPEGIYQSPHYQDDFNLNTSETDFSSVSDFEHVLGDDYIFKSVVINRKTLSVKHRKIRGLVTKHYSRVWEKCEETSTDTFYELVADKTKKLKKELKF